MPSLASDKAFPIIGIIIAIKTQSQVPTENKLNVGWRNQAIQPIKINDITPDAIFCALPTAIEIETRAQIAP